MLLLVDDNLEQLELRQMILERAGFAVAIAASPVEAMERCEPCESVVMDLRLPKLDDGLALIRHLHVRVPGASIIVLSGLPEELSGRPERSMVHHLLRKGTGTRVLIEILRTASSQPTI